MLPVCHGFGGKVPSYGEWKAGHQGEELYCIYIWSLCGEVLLEEWESVCQTEYNCVSVGTYLIGSGFFIGSQN